MTRRWKIVADEPVAWLRDLDDTGSLHVCASGDAGAEPVAFLSASPPVPEDVVERVARALAAVKGEDPDAEGSIFDLCGEHGEPLPRWRFYEEDARAVLAALEG